MRKKVDSRLRTLVENGVKLNHRSFFVVVGDKGRDQVVNLHYMLAKSRVRANPSVLWMYKKDLGFSSHRKKREKQIKREIKRGMRAIDESNPFELFISATQIRYVFYKDSHKVLGQTFDMCILQDFEALTPNLLARSIETVSGGGLVILLLKTMTSLKQLYEMTMDVHQRYRTEAHRDVVCRFNERFLLSLSSCEQCLVVDDELNVLNVSSNVHNIKPVSLPEQDSMDDDENTDAHLSPSQNELKLLKIELKDSQPTGGLVEICRTLDQAKALLTFTEAIQEKTIRSTVALTAGRGRGKSAALGLAIAMAIANGYANIFVTSPAPENLGTVFEFLFKGFDALEFKEHLDYEVVQSTNPEFNKAVVRVNVFKRHRQTVQYIQPGDHLRLSQAELVVIDEAAAIPLTLVQKLMGPYLVFLSSTVNGYEGTGRSLSLKLIKQLRERSVAGKNSMGSSAKKLESRAAQTLREIELEEPIRYAPNDSVERWLVNLLCLDCSGKAHRITHGTPHPSKCELYHVNRDTLFSYHKASEAFLTRMMSLYVSSHYKNSPDDLQLMSDAPAHRLFVLLGPVQSDAAVPDILCVIQVALEGHISKESVKRSLGRGQRASGDLIPWTVCQQFQDYEFGSLSGARVVRIATHPDVQKMGYGTRAIELLSQYYSGVFVDLNEDQQSLLDQESKENATADQDMVVVDDLRTQDLKPRANLSPLLEPVTRRKPESLHWLGVSYGLTPSLFAFWSRNKMSPVYLRQTANTLTGEHTTIMLKTLSSEASSSSTSSSIPRGVPNEDWLKEFCADFRRRFLSLLAFTFRGFSTSLALSVLDLSPSLVTSKRGLRNAKRGADQKPVTYEELRSYVTEYDLKRLESYASHLVDYHMILDLIPSLARLFFLERLDSEVTLTMGQCAVLLGLGLQYRTVSDIEKELPINSQQILAFFNQVIRKFSKSFRSLAEAEVAADISKKESVQAARRVRFTPLRQSLDDDMDSAAAEVDRKLKAQQASIMKGLKNIDRYQVAGDDADWSEAISASRGSVPSTISIKKSDANGASDDDAFSEPLAKSSKKSKKHKKDKKRHAPPSGDSASTGAHGGSSVDSHKKQKKKHQRKDGSKKKHNRSKNKSNADQ